MKLQIKALIFILALSIFSFSCKDGENSEAKTYVLIETELGNMKVLLYNNTPKHKANFIKLVEEGFYDDLLFHRIIKGFMIQGGDPDSKGATQDQMLGNGSPGYTIPAEFVPENFHKKGALAAARLGDKMNPKKESSGSQFYFVQGKKYTEKDINSFEQHINNKKKQVLYNKYFSGNPDDLAKMQEFQEKAMFKQLDSLFESINTKVNYSEVEISKEQREVYSQIGGTPFLDGEYTVFGEIVEGLEVLDKIANVEIGEHNRPKVNLKLKMKIISE